MSKYLILQILNNSEQKQHNQEILQRWRNKIHKKQLKLTHLQREQMVPTRDFHTAFLCTQVHLMPSVSFPQSSDHPWGNKNSFIINEYFSNKFLAQSSHRSFLEYNFKVISWLLLLKCLRRPSLPNDKLPVQI